MKEPEVALADHMCEPEDEAIARFNAELALLDRPLEDEIEYYDEPRPRRWRRLGAIAVALMILGGGGLLMIGHSRASAAPPAPPASPIVALRAAGAPAVPEAAVEAPAAAEAPRKIAGHRATRADWARAARHKHRTNR
jgi:hypothetical protein